MWYTFEGGRVVRVASPAAAKASFDPWTVQSRAAGFLKLDSELYVAVNGWGVAAVPVAFDGGSPPTRFRSFDERRFFGGRTINGLFAENGKILLDLYHNTVFSTEAPQSSPLTFARFDAATGEFAAVRLPPSRANWEAVDVVHTGSGRWAFAWKKSTADSTQFRFSLYDPATKTEEPIDRDTFFASYGFVDVAQAPPAVRALARLAVAAVRGTAATVVHLEVRGAPYERVERFCLGSDKLLAAGDARLVIIPVVRASGRLYALLPAGRLLWVLRAAGRNRSGELRLPALPPGLAYTDFWTNGRLLVASWEQQHFAEVGAAGIYVLERNLGRPATSERGAAAAGGEPARGASGSSQGAGAPRFAF